MIRDREALEERANSPIDIPQRYLDVHDFFFGPPLGGRSQEILRRHRPDYLMVRQDEPLNAELEDHPAFSPVDTPGDAYDLYKVDLDALQPAE